MFRRFVVQPAGTRRYALASPHICVYLHSTSKQKSERGGHFSMTKVTFPNAGKLLPGRPELEDAVPQGTGLSGTGGKNHNKTVQF